MFEVSTRPPTPDEARVIEGRAGVDKGSWGCLFVFLLLPLLRWDMADNGKFVVCLFPILLCQLVPIFSKG